MSAAQRRWRLTFVVVAIAVAIGALVVVYRETRQAERDRHTLLHQLAEIERMIRAHDPGLWSLVETGPAPGGGGSAADPQRQQIFGDFDRLSHLSGFSMKDLQLEIDGDDAVARYTVEGVAPRWQAARPVRGEIRFRRTAAGWGIVGHRLEN